MLYSDTPVTDQEVDAYRQAWTAQYLAAHAGTEAGTDAKAKTELYEKMYRDLNSLDAKANSVFTLVAMLITLQGVIIAFRGEIFDGTMKWPIQIGFYTAVLAAICGLRVVWVVWAHGARIQRGNYDLAVTEIIRVRSRRTITHRVSIYFCIVSLFAFAFVALWVFTGTSS
jgi:hypothetical protein